MNLYSMFRINYAVFFFRAPLLMARFRRFQESFSVAAVVNVPYAFDFKIAKENGTKKFLFATATVFNFTVAFSILNG